MADDAGKGTPRSATCPECGAPAVEGASFCGSCGQSLTSGSAEDQPSELATASPDSEAATGENVGVSGNPRRGWKWLILPVAVGVIAGAVASVVLLSGGKGGQHPAQHSASAEKAAIDYAPAGSTPSFADGYNSATRVCKSGGWSTCIDQLQAAQSQGSTATAESYCGQIEADPSNYGGPSTGDIRSQWLQGCEAAYGYQSQSTTSPTSAGTASATPTTTTGSASTPRSVAPPSTTPRPTPTTAPVSAPVTTTPTTTEPPTTTTTQMIVMPSLIGQTWSAAEAELQSLQSTYHLEGLQWSASWNACQPGQQPQIVTATNPPAGTTIPTTGFTISVQVCENA